MKQEGRVAHRHTCSGHSPQPHCLAARPPLRLLTRIAGRSDNAEPDFPACSLPFAWLHLKGRLWKKNFTGYPEVYSCHLPRSCLRKQPKYRQKHSRKLKVKAQKDIVQNRFLRIIPLVISVELKMLTYKQLKFSFSSDTDTRNFSLARFLYRRNVMTSKQAAQQEYQEVHTYLFV